MAERSRWPDSDEEDGKEDMTTAIDALAPDSDEELDVPGSPTRAERYRRKELEEEMSGEFTATGLSDDDDEEEEEEEDGIGPDSDGEDGAATARVPGVPASMQLWPVGSSRSGMVECTLVRHRTGMHRLYPHYELYLESGSVLLLEAKKQKNNKTSNYHLFDATRGKIGTRLSKKSGNYIGKLRSNYSKTENTLYGRDIDAGSDRVRTEFAGVLYDKPSLLERITDGTTPRHFRLVLPPLREDGTVACVRSEVKADSLVEKAKAGRGDGLRTLISKKPFLRKGQYILDFMGRVSKPSVKNFQVVDPENTDDILLQFGKVGEDEFHLDFKQPFTPFQAFAIALCQFNW